MFRLSSPGHRARHVALRRSAPMLACSFGKRELQSAAPVGEPMHFSSSVNVLKSLNPLKMFQDAVNAMKHDTATTGFKFHIRPAVFVISIVAVIAVSTVMTLIFSTRGVTKGYVLRDLQFKRQALVRENEVMTMQLAQAQSLHSVVTNDILFSMRPAKNVIHLGGGSSIASR